MTSEEFRSALLNHAELVRKRHELCKTEEASKTALILPFFRDVLGYDTFDPTIFVPEFTADVGIKKGERVDYAILRDGTPEILIEAKWNGATLDGCESQLYRYFGTTSAKLGILTNGVEYRFFGDLDGDNRMDITPFSEINMLDLSEQDIRALEHYQFDNFDIDAVIESATDMKYSSAITALLEQLFSDPDNEFTAFLMKRVYSGKKTTKNARNFQTIVKTTMGQFLEDKLQARLAAIEEEERKREEERQEANNGIVTTDEEIEAYIIIRTMLRNVVAPERILYKDCKSYFGVLLDGKTNKWVCRLYPSAEGLWKIYYPDDGSGKQDAQVLASNHDLYSCLKRLEAAVRKYL